MNIFQGEDKCEIMDMKEMPISMAIEGTRLFISRRKGGIL